MPKLNKVRLNRQANVSHLTTREAELELKTLSDIQRLLKQKYDIFLSHSFLDAKIILALKKILESTGLKVFVDWTEAPLQNRESVNPATAALLREAMKSSNSLLYAVSENADSSKWMPWELGYSDGLHSRVAIVPISEYESRKKPTKEKSIWACTHTLRLTRIFTVSGKFLSASPDLPSFAI